MKEVRLYGVLAKKFGKSFFLAIETPAEAIRALKAILPGFKDYMVHNSEPGYHVFLGKMNIGRDELSMTTSSEIIKIVPATIGSGGFFKVILGGILAIVGAWTSNPALVKMGVGMMLSGVAEILFAPPKPKSSVGSEKQGNAPSYIFNGPVNTIAQGNPVPLCYGKMKVGSQVISAGMSAKDIPISTPVTTDSASGKFVTII